MSNAKKLIPFVPVQGLKLGGLTINDPRKAEYMRNSGSLLGLKGLAEARNLNITGDAGKANRKALLKELDGLRVAQNNFGRQVLGACLADPMMAARKLKFARNKDGEVTGVDVAMRIDSKVAGGQAVKLAKENADLKAQLAQLQLKLTAPATA